MAGTLQKLFHNFYVGTIDPRRSTFTLPLKSIYLDTEEGVFYRVAKKNTFSKLFDIDNGGSTGGNGSVTETFKHFTGDGSKKNFDFDDSIDVIRVDINGVVLSDNDYEKEDNIVKFNTAPDDGAEVTICSFTA